MFLTRRDVNRAREDEMGLKEVEECSVHSAVYESAFGYLLKKRRSLIKSRKSGRGRRRTPKGHLG